MNENWVKLNEFEIIPYVFIGIVQGYSYEDVVPLFDNNNIVVDYYERGFVNNMPNKLLKMKILYNWYKMPMLFKTVRI